MSEPMSPYFAVFNCDINNAHCRAVSAFNKQFGARAWTRTGMAKLWREGIMVIFQKRPTIHTRFYVEKVHQFVNEAPTTKNRRRAKAASR